MSDQTSSSESESADASYSPAMADQFAFGNWVLGFWKPHGIAARVATILAAAVSCEIFVLGSRWFNIPRLPGFDGSLLHQSSAAAALFALLGVAILLLVATLVGTILAGAVRFEAGLFAAALGLGVISARSGTTRSVLFESNGAHVYWILSVEVIVLGVILYAMWELLGRLRKQQAVIAVVKAKSDDANSSKDGSEQTESAESSMRFMALAVQVAATAILTMILCQTEAKTQSLVSVGIAAFLGTITAYLMFPSRPSIWYWMGPLVVGVLGYVLASFSHDPQMAIGNAPELIQRLQFGALARPLPLDYASAGTAGAILGYWLVRQDVKPERADKG